MNTEPAFTGPAGAPRDERLSIIVVCYNMARELPRTLETLSARMQAGMSEDDYEIIVVDNGSSAPADRDACQAIAANCRFLDVDHPTVSPAGAMALGVSQARFPLLGIMVDGARMASPGLLSTARLALRLSRHAVVGTIGFHLGPKVQMKSVLEGYNQVVEDQLLDSVDWRADGYALFSICALAGSSAKGWFHLPSETNALFLSREEYERLGGYDLRFQSPGGGLINHDFWNRICADEKTRLIMLLGEGTFHQVHGGVASNATESPWSRFAEEYETIKGTPYRHIRKPFSVFGRPDFIDLL